MLTQTYNYNQIVKKSIAIFGNLFNNITIGRVAENGTVSNIERVPISYGPKQKFLDRITEQPDLSDDKVAIKVPRISFEMTSIQYDTSIKLNRLNTSLTPTADNPAKRNLTWQSVPYSINVQLNIYGRNQDDVLQILEQVLPQFQPEYTVTIKDMEYPGSLSDVPVTLNSITLSDDYDGSFTVRRAIVYTLEFTMRIRFSGPISSQSIIKFVEAGIHPSNLTGIDTTNPAGEFVHVQVSSANDTPSNYTVIQSIDTFGFSEGYEPTPI